MREPTRKLMELLGYKKLYPPQEEAIKRGVEDGVNLLVATPTASGKTFIGLTAVVNRLLAEGGRAVYLVPLKSIAGEKYDTMGILGRMGLSIGLQVGDLVLGHRNPSVLITTYEKFDSLLRNNPSLLENIRVVVVDEIHYLGDPKRGVILESVLARILSSGIRPQIVALSATVPNADEIADWLGAEAIISDWRPVPLREAVFKPYRLYYPLEGEEEPVEKITGRPYLDLAISASREGGQALVFSQSRRRVVTLAQRSAEHGGHLNFDRSKAKVYARRILESGGPLAIREGLAKLILRGVAYHHAGLSTTQRRVIESAFREGAISIIHATPTLAAGVNLPARLVVVEEYYRFEAGYRRPIPAFEYKQLAGRAGRPGYDEVGLAVIIASQHDSVEEIAETYILGSPERVESKIAGVRGLRHILLGLASSGGTSLESIKSFMRHTLYAHQFGGMYVLNLMVERALHDLRDWGLVSVFDSSVSPTPLGLEVAKVYLDPESVKILKDVLGRAKVLNDNVLIYTITLMPDAQTLPVGRREAEKLMDILIEEYPELIDIVEAFDPTEARAFKTMLLIKMWIEEAKEDELYSKLGAGSGDISAIVETASWIAGGLARIAPHAGLSEEVADRFAVLSARIKHGVRPELLQLVAIPGVGRVRARRLYDAGYRTLADLATARPEDLLRIKGLGPGTVRAILEFLGRKEEAEKLRVPPRGLDAYL
ncbi:MAG: DEAD/DEAH box helicase [Desulfurococcales archaeon]|nr:DEAD/DEAH box helicase [Desulfurococcales archaeon]